MYDKNKTIMLACPGGKIRQGKIRIMVPNTVQSIDEDAFDHYSDWPKKNVTLVSYEGSPAQKYALANEMAFEISGKAPVVKITITFDANGGTNMGWEKLKLTKGKTFKEMALNLPSAKQKGYSFLGWYTSRTGGTRVAAETKFAGSRTVYAHWQKVAKPKKAGKPSLKSKRKGQLTVSYKKVSGAKGYEICYSMKKNFKGAKNVATTKVEATIKKLKKKKIYYVRIRAYKLDSTGEKIYGNYGASRKLKVK